MHPVPDSPLSIAHPTRSRSRSRAPSVRLMDCSSGSISSTDEPMPEASRGLIDFTTSTPHIPSSSSRPKQARTVSGKGNAKRRPLEERTNAIDLPSDPIFKVAPPAVEQVPTKPHPSTAPPARRATRVFAGSSPPTGINTLNLVAVGAYPKAQLGFPYVQRIPVLERIAAESEADWEEEKVHEGIPIDVRPLPLSPHLPAQPEPAPRARLPSPESPSPPRPISTLIPSRLLRPPTPHPSRMSNASFQHRPPGFFPAICALVASYIPSSCASTASRSSQQSLVQTPHAELRTLITALVVWAIDLFFLRTSRGGEPRSIGTLSRVEMGIKSAPIEKEEVKPRGLFGMVKGAAMSLGSRLSRWCYGRTRLTDQVPV